MLSSRKLMDIVEGEYRVFFNFYRNGEQINLGFPKSTNYSDVYIKINGETKPRISIPEATRYLSMGMSQIIESTMGRALFSSQSYRMELPF